MRSSAERLMLTRSMLTDRLRGRTLGRRHSDRSDHVGYRTLTAADALWRPSGHLGVMNADLAKQLGATTLGARLWRLAPGQASTRHRHFKTHELYVLLEGTGQIRIGENLHTLEALSSVLVEPDEIR